MSILFVASEATELKPLALHLENLRKLPWPIDYAYEGIANGQRFILAAHGAGPKLAERATEVAIRAVSGAKQSSSQLEAVVSTGYAGALDPKLRVGDIVVATQILEPATQEIYLCAELPDQSPPPSCEPTDNDAPAEPRVLTSGTGGRHAVISTEAAGLANFTQFFQGIVLSQDRIATNIEEKGQLFRQTGACCVEMEAAGVALRAKRAGLPFYCIKVVSDTANESFALDFNKMRTSEGRLARGKIMIHALAHPILVPGLFRLKRRTEEVARALGEFLVSCRIGSDIHS
jgi:adenosylhomocysteine nucleosidase